MHNGRIVADFTGSFYEKIGQGMGIGGTKQKATFEAKTVKRAEKLSTF